MRSGSVLAERRDLASLGEPLQGLGLDLPYALSCQPELLPDLLERLRIAVAVHAVAELDHVAFALRQGVDRTADGVLREADVHFLGRLGRLSGDQVAEARVALCADRLVEARDRAGGGPYLLHVLQRELRLLGDLLVGRIALELRSQLAICARDLLLALDDMHGNADRA